ncbi:MAG: hypothetical protein K5639_07740 [Eubacterium sp.]|nr:hypothetical protein [Eubacterium sp.]
MKKRVLSVVLMYAMIIMGVTVVPNQPDKADAKSKTTSISMFAGKTKSASYFVRPLEGDFDKDKNPDIRYYMNTKISITGNTNKSVAKVTKKSIDKNYGGAAIYVKGLKVGKTTITAKITGHTETTYNLYGKGKTKKVKNKTVKLKIKVTVKDVTIPTIDKSEATINAKESELPLEIYEDEDESDAIEREIEFFEDNHEDDDYGAPHKTIHISKMNDVSSVSIKSKDEKIADVYDYYEDGDKESFFVIRAFGFGETEVTITFKMKANVNGSNKVTKTVKVNVVDATLPD